MDTKMKLSSAYHPQTDDQTKRTIQCLEDLFRAYVFKKGGSLDTYLPLINFTYNNIFNSSIRMVPL